MKNKNTEKIDRFALVTRHNIKCNDVCVGIPIGNGEFCFTADGTGLQTFKGNTMSHWAWHSFPLPAGYTQSDIPTTGSFMQGRLIGNGADLVPPDKSALGTYMFDNPHIMNLARFRLLRADGRELSTSEITNVSRTLDLWTGTQTSDFILDGQNVTVVTLVHPSLDAVAVQVESSLINQSALMVVIDFPYPNLYNGDWVGDFNNNDAHKTTMIQSESENRADFTRQVNSENYFSSLSWNVGNLTTIGAHSYSLNAKGSNTLEFVCAFYENDIGDLPSFINVNHASKIHWSEFWNSGGAIDLSESKDDRWVELERRIVLSQYLLAVQSAGRYPSAESGLMGIDAWRSQYHMEMTWWHLAHYGLWDRWSMADKALSCYQNFLPIAQQLASQLNYKGAKWGKMLGPEGRTAPWIGNLALLWKQPHPIFFAELEYNLKPTDDTLNKWANIINETAKHMADYATPDENGVYHLAPSMPPSEQGFTFDSVFDLAYWSWGLSQAQIWRERMGFERVVEWDLVIENLAPLPIVDGVYVHSSEWTDTYTKRAFEHPDPIGVYGMLPLTDAVDPKISLATLLKVWNTWDFDRIWGWDFPWIAMSAARVGKPQIAVEALLKGPIDVIGASPVGSYPYLPANGGILYAVAMMAAGWDEESNENAPGFPDDGSWSVKWEGLKRPPASILTKKY